MNTDYDAIVVGSGITGGWAAKALCEKGLKVLVLERGRTIEHNVDYQGAFQPPWKRPYGGFKVRGLYAADYPIQSVSGVFDESTRHFFNNDRRNPYDFDAAKPFLWIRADVLGGKSLIWGRQVYRWSDLDFEANGRDGHGIDWPIRYADLEPWYSHVERFIGVSGEKLGLPHLPDGEFQKPMELNHVEKLFRAKMRQHYATRAVTIGRVAIQTEARNDRGACTYCYACARGCTYGAYFNSLVSTLPAAQATGNLTIRSDSVVASIDYDPARKRATGVRVIDTRSRQRHLFTARLIFLCGSTLGSTQILLNSKSETFPNGLANSSGVLGRYLMDHTYGNGAFALFPGHLDKYPYGYRPNALYVPRYRNVQGQDADMPFVRGYNYQGMAWRVGWEAMQHQVTGFGKDFKAAMRGPGPWAMVLNGFGEMLPDRRNRVFLHPSKKDAYGIPQLSFDVAFRDNERLMQADILAQAKGMLEAAGAHAAQTFSEWTPGRGIHEMGTARMGHDPSDSVLNKWNQSHDVPNLFVTDGACMTSSSCVSPSLTFMALTARAADHAATLLKAGQI